jgi:hypothetical protein
MLAGWSHDHSAVVSQAVFQSRDNRLDLQRARGARTRHPRQSRPGIVQRAGRPAPGHGWGFATNDGLALPQHGDGPIVQPRTGRHTASPLHGDWRDWAARRGRSPGLPRRGAALLK